MSESRTILIGGEAGQGLATVGQLLTKSLVRAGYPVVVTQDYMSRIRGGHNTFAIRTGDGCYAAPEEKVDVLVALNAETVRLHKDKLVPDGLVVLDEALDTDGAKGLKVPFGEIAPKKIFENTVALGILCALLGIDRSVPAGLLEETFRKKGEDVVSQNLAVLDDAFNWCHAGNVGFTPLPKAEERGRRMMITGNEAISLGALAAGVKFCSFYPMTPATSVAMNLIANAARTGVVVEQAEDEIAAVNMGLGASFAGARTLVPTSGGGMALMVEGVSLAGITETPIVLVLAQRPGPATGLPTRTEQGDLNLALYAGHGEFPRAILAPGSVEQCFHLTHRSFDLAEKYQSPVFVLTDQFLADSFRDVEPFDLRALPEVASPGFETDDPGGYERYAVTESGVSPRLVPGFGEYVVVLDSDEHTPDGHITEDLAVRVTMQDKRMRKLDGLRSECIAPNLHGDVDEDDAPELLFVCWGSSEGAVTEAADRLRAEGRKVAVMHFLQVYPLDPSQFLSRLESAGRVVCVEGNSTGQFADLLLRESDFRCHERLLRYDGLPFTANYILDRLDRQGGSDGNN